MLTRPETSPPAALAAAPHDPHPHQWVVDAQTRRVVKRPCLLCDVLGKERTAHDSTVRSA